MVQPLPGTPSTRHFAKRGGKSNWNSRNPRQAAEIIAENLNNNSDHLEDYVDYQDDQEPGVFVVCMTCMRTCARICVYLLRFAFILLLLFIPDFINDYPAPPPLEPAPITSTPIYPSHQNVRRRRLYSHTFYIYCGGTCVSIDLCIFLNLVFICLKFFLYISLSRGVVHWRGLCCTLKRIVWYFEEGGMVLWRGVVLYLLFIFDFPDESVAQNILDFLVNFRVSTTDGISFLSIQ